MNRNTEAAGALERTCPQEQPTAAELAAQLIAELTRTGRYRGRGAVLVVTPGHLASICCVVRTAEPAISLFPTEEQEC